MVKNRRANAVLFGFDFQRNAAIILMLERIKELRSVRLEGNEEDIELTLENGKKILAQAKAVEKSSSDFSHVRENLKKSIDIPFGRRTKGGCSGIDFHNQFSKSFQ